MSDTPSTVQPNDPGEVVEAWSDVIYFTDSAGIVTEMLGRALSYMPASSPLGIPLWTVLALETSDLTCTLRKYPPLEIHEVSLQSNRSYLLRIIPLPTTVMSKGGYVVIVTDNRPMEALYETYEERLEDNIAAWSDSIALFNAFFDTAKDAVFLVGEDGIILSANVAAQHKHAERGQSLAGTHCPQLLGRRFRAMFEQAMTAPVSRSAWTQNVVALDGQGEAFPAEATLRKIALSGYSLFQFVLHDLTTQVGLEEDLEEMQAEVEEKDIALKQVILSVEEERQKMRDQLTDHVKKQVLPALERITSSDAPEVREGYKTVIEDQLGDFSGGALPGLDSDILRLSPREMEVCQLIQLGRSGKEIAQTLSMSFETVQTHRKNIRRKLKLRGKQISLYVYLRNKPSLT